MTYHNKMQITKDCGITSHSINRKRKRRLIMNIMINKLFSQLFSLHKVLWQLIMSFVYFESIYKSRGTYKCLILIVQYISQPTSAHVHFWTICIQGNGKRRGKFFFPFFFPCSVYVEHRFGA